MSNGLRRRGAGRHEMRTSNADRLTAATAEHLLGGGEGPDGLRQLLAAAAGPGTARELAGEAAAVAAFVDAPRASSLPSAPSRRPSMLSTALSKIVAAKAVAAVVLLAGATGGVALAATTSGASDAPPTDRPAATRTAAPSATGGNRPEAGDGTARPETPAPATSASPQPSLAGLCTAWTAGATDNPGAAAENPAFRSLVDAAGSPAEVPDYCADLKDAATSRPSDTPRGRDGEHRTGPPADTPRAGNRGVPPTAAPGNPDHAVGPSAEAGEQGGAKGEGSSSRQGDRQGDQAKRSDSAGE